MAVTSHDVAREAGVSQPTVSRALRDDPAIALKTRERIAQVAARLGYVPSELGRSLSARRTRRVAVVVDLDNPLWSLLVEELHDELSAQGYSMTLLTAHGDGTRPLGDQLLGGWADGVLVTSARLEGTLPTELRRRRIPFVLVNRTLTGVRADAAVAANRSGGQMAARLLAEAGHTRVGAMFGPPDTSTGRERERGFREGLEAAGLTLAPSRVRHGAFEYAFGREVLPELLKGRHPATAIFCSNDIIAMGAMNTAHRLGVRVPGDVALVGFDDLDQASWPLYDLTTIKVPFAAMVHTAISLLLERIDGHDGPARVRSHPVQAVLRATHRA